jgi:hypothetical protein
MAGTYTNPSHTRGVKRQRMNASSSSEAVGNLGHSEIDSESEQYDESVPELEDHQEFVPAPPSEPDETFLEDAIETALFYMLW